MGDKIQHASAKKIYDDVINAELIRLQSKIDKTVRRQQYRIAGNAFIACGLTLCYFAGFFSNPLEILALQGANVAKDMMLGSNNSHSNDDYYHMLKLKNVSRQV